MRTENQLEKTQTLPNLGLLDYLGKVFTLHALNYFGETNYTVTVENIGGWLVAHAQLSDYRVIHTISLSVGLT